MRFFNSVLQTTQDSALNDAISFVSNQYSNCGVISTGVPTCFSSGRSGEISSIVKKLLSKVTTTNRITEPLSERMGFLDSVLQTTQDFTQNDAIGYVFKSTLQLWRHSFWRKRLACAFFELMC